MKRKCVAAVLLGVACSVLSAILIPVVETVPASLRAAEHQSTIELSANDTTTLFSSDCVQAHWKVTNIRAVELDRHGVVGEGTALSCDSSIDLRVTFQDGTQKTYSIPKQSQSASFAQRLLIVGAILALGLGIILMGWPTYIRIAFQRSRGGRWLGSWLPTAHQFSDDRILSGVVLLSITAIILIGAVARATYLSQSLGYDETWTYVEFASQPLRYIVTNYHSTNNHIFQTLLMSLSIRVFGLHPWSMRLSVYFAGILLIAAVFAMARRFYGVRAGLVAAAFSAGASWLIEFSTNARGYSLVVLIFLVLLLLATTLRRKHSKYGWLAFALLGAVGLYTVPSMAYPLGLVCTWLGLSILVENAGRRRQLLMRDMVLSILVLIGIAGLLYVPAYLYLHSHPRADAFSFDPISWGDFIEIYRREFGDVWSAMTRDLSMPVLTILVIGVGAASLFHLRITRSRVSFVVAALLWLPAILFIQLVTTYDRLWLFLLPLILIMAAGGLFFLWRAQTSLPLPSIRCVAIAAVVIAVWTSLGTIRSDSVEQFSRGDRALGADTVVQWLHEHVPNNPTVLCAAHCYIYRVYGLMYGVPIVRLFDDATDSSGAIYIVNKSLTTDVNVSEMVKHVNVPADRFEPPVLVLSERDARLYRLDHRPAQ